VSRQTELIRCNGDLICGFLPFIDTLLCAGLAASEITPVLEVFSLGNQTSLLALPLIGYNAAQLPGELSPQPGMVIKRAF